MQKWTEAKTRFVAACAMLALMAAMAKPAKAGGLGADTIGLFPKSVGEFAYADLKKARTMKWYPALEQQMLPAKFKQFEKFLAAAGIDTNTQVDELTWALVPESALSKDAAAGAAATEAPPDSEEIVGIALGSYNPDSTEAYFKAQKLPTSKSHGYTLFAFGSGVGPNDLFFFFVDSNKAAFGHRQLLEKLIAVRYGEEDSLLRNDKLYNMINEVNGSGVIWAVLDPAYTKLAMGQLAPEVQQFPEAAKLVARMQAMLITATASSGVDAKFQAVCGSTEDANTLSQLMAAGLLYKKYQTAKDNPELGALLDQTNVVPSGDRVVIRMTVSDEQMTTLIQKNTFAIKM
ncbi:MAG TPA: hypothetical protein VNY24_16300 [Candidatus Acidoferrales bacterium]|jgi:hypothetical protein|nr:hypothetical protein [Candidatus Acidoferrales bacterium]